MFTEDLDVGYFFIVGCWHFCSDMSRVERESERARFVWFRSAPAISPCCFWRSSRLIDYVAVACCWKFCSDISCGSKNRDMHGFCDLGVAWQLVRGISQGPRSWSFMSSLFAVGLFVPVCCCLLFCFFLGGSKVFQWQVLCTLSVSPKRAFLSRTVWLACDYFRYDAWW